MNMAKCNLIKLNQKHITPEARFASKSPFADFLPCPSLPLYYVLFPLIYLASGTVLVVVAAC